MKKIEYYHKNSDVIAYEKTINEDGCWLEKTYNEKGRELIYKDSYGDWSERIYDEKGNQLTYRNSNGYWNKRTYDEKGNTLTFKNSDGYWEERTYDEKGRELTYKDSYSNYQIKGRKVIKEKFEAFVNSLENHLLSKIAELEKQLDELKKLVK